MNIFESNNANKFMINEGVVSRNSACSINFIILY